MEFQPDARHFELLEVIFSRVPIHRYWRCSIRIQRAVADLTMPVQPEFFNPLGGSWRKKRTVRRVSDRIKRDIDSVDHHQRRRTDNGPRRLAQS